MGKKKIFVGRSAVYTTNSGLKASLEFESPADSATPKNTNIPDVETDNSGNSQPWVPWGEDNNFPNELVEKLGKLSIGNRSIALNADLHYGNGVEFFKKIRQGEAVTRQAVEVPDWQAFRQKTQFDIILSEIIETLERFYWAPVKFLTNRSRTKIVAVEVLDPCFTRLGKRSKINGRIEKVYFSYKFGENEPKKGEYVEYNVYDPKNPRKYSEFVVNLMYPTPGKPYYPEPEYYAAFRNGWVDIAISVAEFIKTIYEHSASIKYHIEIPDAYFTERFPGWENFDQPKRDECIDQVTEEMDKFLMGKKNAHKTFVSFYSTNDSGKAIDGFKITAINEYLRKDADLPNNAAANSEILFSFGIDPSIIGLGIPGGKELSGSGSDKRISVQIKQGLARRERLYSAQAINFIIFFNGINTEGAEPEYTDMNITTLDKNKEGKEPVVNG